MTSSADLAAAARRQQTDLTAPLDLRFKSGLVYLDRSQSRYYVMKVEGTKVHVIRLRDSRIGSLKNGGSLFGGIEPTKAEQKQIDALMAEEAEREALLNHPWCPGSVALLTDRSKASAKKAGMNPNATYVVTKVNPTTVDVVPLGTTDGVNYLRMSPLLLTPATLISTAVKAK